MLAAATHFDTALGAGRPMPRLPAPSRSNRKRSQMLHSPKLVCKPRKMLGDSPDMKYNDLVPALRWTVYLVLAVIHDGATSPV